MKLIKTEDENWMNVIWLLKIERLLDDTFLSILIGTDMDRWSFVKVELLLIDTFSKFFEIPAKEWYNLGYNKYLHIKKKSDRWWWDGKTTTYLQRNLRRNNTATNKKKQILVFEFQIRIQRPEKLRTTIFHGQYHDNVNKTHIFPWTHFSNHSLLLIISRNPFNNCYTIWSFVTL